MVGAQGQAKLAKKSSTYDVTHKNPHPQAKNFFRVQTTRLAASFDTSTRCVTCTGAEIFLRKTTCDPAVFLRTAWINPDVKVLTWAKMAQKLFHLWRHSQKIHNPQPKNLFQVQSRRLAESFEGLNSSLAQSVEELWHWYGNQKLLVSGRFPGTIHS